jgi:hypothetical protein
LLGKPCVFACCISRSTQDSTLLFALLELQALSVAANSSTAKQTRTFETV